MAESNRDADLNALGKDLQGLMPRACPINRDAVMFRAGQASVPWNWKWPFATALSSCVAVTFAAALLLQPALPSPTIQPYYSGPIRGPIPPPAASWSSNDPPGGPMTPGDVMTANEEPLPTPDTAYFHAQDSLLRWGLDGLPMPPLAAPPPALEKREMLLRSF
jgi:hypothetical protein